MLTTTAADTIKYIQCSILRPENTRLVWTGCNVLSDDGCKQREYIVIERVKGVVGLPGEMEIRRSVNDIGCCTLIAVWRVLKLVYTMELVQSRQRASML